MMRGERRVSLRGEKRAQNELVPLRWGRGGGVGVLGSRDCKVGVAGWWWLWGGGGSEEGAMKKKRKAGVRGS